jgi:hypothetical protein
MITVMPQSAKTTGLLKEVGLRGMRPDHLE